jgi:hypothetical protein
VSPAALLTACALTGALWWASPSGPSEPPAQPSPVTFEAYVYGEIPAQAVEASQTTVEAATSVVEPEIGRCTAWSAIAASEGFTEAEIDVLERILWLESRCETTVVGDAEHGGSYGIAQIHTSTWCKPSKYWPAGYLQAHGIVLTCDDLFAPAIAIKAARAIYVAAGHSFEPWTTYDIIKGGTK